MSASKFLRIALSKSYCNAFLKLNVLIILIISIATISSTLWRENAYSTIKKMVVVSSTYVEANASKYKQFNWLNYKDLVVPEDMFSATWLQRKDQFLKMKIQEQVHTVEDGCFAAVYKNGLYKKVQMTFDWLDFSVEHMSKWWKMTNVFGADMTSFNLITNNLMNYVKQTKHNIYNMNQTRLSLTPLHPTIAVIAFQPYKPINKDNNNNTLWKAKRLTMLSLAATISSLVWVGFGRIVVIGYFDTDSIYVQHTFHLLNNLNLNSQTELAYVRVTNETWIESKFIKVNMPKAALIGLKYAMQGKLDENNTNLWLGTRISHDYWKYVYLTEPDTILQTRQYVLKHIQNALDNGIIVVPHRLQPIPHEIDLKGMERKDLMMPSVGAFATIVILNGNKGDSCYDLGNDRPGKKINDGCGAFWWQCNLGNTYNPRFVSYEFMRISSGTNIVLLAANEHGRQCKPQHNQNSLRV
eukprot:130871_1